MEESLIIKLISSIKCGSCKRNYDEDHIEIVEHRDALWFLRVICPACHVRCLVAAIIRNDSRPELITDLTGDELEKFRDAGAVQDEDLLEMHRFLKNYNGDVPGLLGQG